MWESTVDRLFREVRELGEGIVLIDQHPKTFMLKTLHAAIKNQFIPDDDIRAHMGRCFSDTSAVPVPVEGNRSGDGVPSGDKKQEGIEESVRDLLLDILHHPYCGMVERYKPLKTSRRKGNNLKDTAPLRFLQTTVSRLQTPKDPSPPWRARA